MFSRIMPAHAAGGMQDHVQTLSAGLVRQGHQVSVVTSARADGKASASVEGVEMHFLPGTSVGRYSAAYWSASARAFERLHAAQRFDVLHSQSVGAFGVYRDKLQRKYHLPLVTSLHGTHLDVLTTSWRTDFALTHPLGMARFGAVALNLLFNYASRDLWFIRGSDAVIATSDADAAKYNALYRIGGDKIRKVYNGIDVRLFAPQISNPSTPLRTSLQSLRRALGIGEHERVILALARLQKDKGVQNAIAVLPRVLAAYPACLVIVGDGDYRATLERLARALGVAARVRFVGALPLAECARYFNLCDVFVDPTLRTDGYDLTIAEAMACAKPVIVSDVGANATLIDRATQRDGILIPCGDNAALTREILRVLGDPARAKRMGEHARAKIAAHFSVEAMVDGMEKVYAEIIARQAATKNIVRESREDR